MFLKLFDNAFVLYWWKRTCLVLSLVYALQIAQKAFQDLPVQIQDKWKQGCVSIKEIFVFLLVIGYVSLLQNGQTVKPGSWNVRKIWRFCLKARSPNVQRDSVCMDRVRPGSVFLEGICRLEHFAEDVSFKSALYCVPYHFHFVGDLNWNKT